MSKKLLFFFLFAVLLSSKTIAQNGIFFQAVARDNFSNPAKDRTIYVQTTISQTTADGPKVLIENFQTNTDGTGVFNISIGQGTRIGGTATNLNTIEWEKGPYFLNLKIAIRPLGPANAWDYNKEWINLGTTPFGTVPYALYAGNTAGLDNKLNISDTAKMLAPYVGMARSSFDSTSLSNRINLKENTANKSTVITLGTSDILYPTQKAVKTYVDAQVATATIADADANTKGKIQLAGDLGGTAALPTVPGLALKANTSDVNTALTLKEELAKKSTNITTDGNSDTKYPSVKAVKTYVDAQVAAATIADADANTKGKIQLAGDLGGNAALPTVPGLSLKANTADVTTALALKANTTDVTTALNTKENNGNKTIDVILDASSDIKYPTAKAVKTYVDASIVANTTPLTFTAPLSKSGFTVSIPQANGSVNGYLNSSDWTSFNNKIDATQKAANNGVATLGNDGKIPSNQIPAISFQSATVVSSQAAMLSIPGAVVGSIAIRTDNNKNYVLSANPATTLVNWVELATPSSVTSVNGFAGPNVSITTNDISEGSTNKYYTDARVKGAISAAAPLTFNTNTGVFSLTAASNTTDGYLTATDWNTFKNKQNALTAGTDYVTPSGNITGNATNVTGVVSIVNGGTGTSTAIGALVNLGAEAITNKSTATDLGNINPSDILYPSQKAIKTYVDQQSANAGVADGSISNAKLGGNITEDKLAGNISNSKLSNSSVTIGTTNIALGATSTSLAGLTSVTATGFTGNLTGNVTGNLTGNVTGNLTGNVTGNLSGNATTATTAGNITATSNNTITSLPNLNSVGTITSGVWSGTTIAIANGGTGATTAAGARTNLGLSIGTDVMSATASTTLTGDVTGSGNGSFATTVNSVGGIAAATIAGLPTSVNANTASITANTNSITNLNTNVSANTASITSLTNLVATNTASISSNTNSINGLTTNVNSNTASITSNTNSIVSNTASITSLTNSVASNTASISSNSNSINALTTNVNSNTASITSNTNSIVSNTASITSLTNSVASNTASITQNTADILLKANIASPSFTGTPTAPTPTTSDNSTKIATTEYVKASITAASAGLSSIGAIAATSNAKGAIISGTTELILTPADVSNGGIVTTGAQTFAGSKTFSSDVTAANFLGNSTTATTAGNITATSNTTLTSLSNLNTVGTITSGVWSGTAIANNKLVNSSTILGSTTMTLGGTVTSVTGLTSLSSTTLIGTVSGTATALTTGRTISTIGDVNYTSGAFDGTTNVTGSATLTNTAVTAGSYGSSTAIPTFTVDAKGRLTAASTVGITAGVSSLNYTSATSYASGGTISGTSLTLAAADATNPGLISTGAQTIAGAKTFGSDVFVNGDLITNSSGSAYVNTNYANKNALVIHGHSLAGTGNTINIVATGSAGGNWTSDMAFLTRPSLGSPTEAMRISSQGYIGIGNSAPAFNLDVTGTSRITSNLNVGGAATFSSTVSVTGATTLSGAAKISNTTASTSTTTGALTVGGGAGIVGNLNVGGNTTISGTISATSFTGALTGNASTATALATGRTISSTGDVTYTSGAFDGTANVTGSATLTNTAVTAGSYGSSTAIPTFTVDAKGRLTAASNVGITAGVSSLNYTSATSYASGGTISGTSLTLAAADATNPGLISTGTQTIVGAKTFSNTATFNTDIKVNGVTVGTGLGSILSNTALGNQALLSNTTGSSNVALGYVALINNLSGTDNVAVGADVLTANTSGGANVALGTASLRKNTTGGHNVSVGYYALSESISGSRNNAFGSRSLRYNTGSDNNSFGEQALYSNTGAGNNAFGNGALYANTTGDNNVAIGYTAMGHKGTGNNNVALGSMAGAKIADGSTNNTASDNSVFLGYGSYPQAISQTNQVVIGYNTVGNGSNTVTIGNGSITKNYFNGDIALTGNITSGTWSGTTIAIANGGTGSTTKNFVDLSSSQTISGTKTFNDYLTIASTTSSSSTSSGAFIVGGGVGIGGAIYAGSIQSTPIGSTTASTGAFTTLTTSGAASLGSTLNVTGAGTFSSTLSAGASTLASATITGNETVGGTLGVTGATILSSTSAHGGAATFSSTVNVTGATTLAALTTTGAATISNTTNSTSSSTGALIVRGGVGVANNLTVGGTIEIDGGSPALGKVLTSDANGLASWTYGSSSVSKPTETATILISDKYVFYDGAADGTLTLPAATNNAGKEIIIKNRTTKVVTVSRSGSTETIFVDSANSAVTSFTIGSEASNNWVKLVSDGSNWTVFRALF